MNAGFQISLNVRGRTCLVIGGDEEAVEKVERLLEAEAKVTVLNPTLHPALRLSSLMPVTFWVPQ